jgi:peroxiredoxin
MKMKKKKLVILTAVPVVFFAGYLAFASWSYRPQYITEPIPTFTLVDQNGKNHSLSEYADHKVLAMVSYNINCHSIPKSLKAIAKLKEKYSGQGIEFLGIDPNVQDSAEKIAAENVEFPVLVDKDQTISRRLGMTRAAEVLLLDTRTWRAFYRGAIAEMGPNKGPEENSDYLDAAIDSFLRKKPIALSETQSLGCAITYLSP